MNPLNVALTHFLRFIRGWELLVVVWAFNFKSLRRREIHRGVKHSDKSSMYVASLIFKMVIK
jgi:hypothetical protein